VNAQITIVCTHSPSTRHLTLPIHSSFDTGTTPDVHQITNLRVIVLHPALRFRFKEATPASVGPRRPFATDSSGTSRGFAADRSTDAEQNRCQKIADEGGPGECHQLSTDMSVEAIASEYVASLDYPGTSRRLAFVGVYANASWTSIARAHRYGVDTYVIRAAPSTWKNRATRAVRALRYPPRRLKSASNPVNKAMWAKKKAMRYQANIKRDR
jgi:hypothetical protein